MLSIYVHYAYVLGAVHTFIHKRLYDQDSGLTITMKNQQFLSLIFTFLQTLEIFVSESIFSNI